MQDDAVRDTKGFHPFGELLGLRFFKQGGGQSQCVLNVGDRLLNPYGGLHGGVIFSLADTGMGSALHSILDKDERSASAHISIVYLKSVTSGSLLCDSTVVHKGRRTAQLESEISNEDGLVSKAVGTFSIFKMRG